MAVALGETPDDEALACVLEVDDLENHRWKSCARSWGVSSPCSTSGSRGRCRRTASSPCCASEIPRDAGAPGEAPVASGVKPGPAWALFGVRGGGSRGRLFALLRKSVWKTAPRRPGAGAAPSKYRVSLRFYRSWQPGGRSAPDCAASHSGARFCGKTSPAGAYKQSKQCSTDSVYTRSLEHLPCAPARSPAPLRAPSCPLGPPAAPRAARAYRN